MLMAIERDTVSTIPAPEPMIWYAVLTERQSERTVQAQIRLLGHGYQAFYPHCLIRQRHERRGRVAERIVERPYFSRYVFAGILPWAPYHPLFSMQGVREVLRTPGAEKPTRIPAEAMGDLLALANDEGLIGGTATALPDHDYRPGDVVRFSTTGPFAGLTCIIQQVDKHGFLRAYMDVLGRLTPIDVHHSQLGEVQKRATPSADALSKNPAGGR